MPQVREHLVHSVQEPHPPSLFKGIALLSTHSPYIHHYDNKTIKVISNTSRGDEQLAQEAVEYFVWFNRYESCALLKQEIGSCLLKAHEKKGSFWYPLV